MNGVSSSPAGGGQMLTLRDRQHLSLNGVSEVSELDECTVVLISSVGRITVEGETLHMTHLDLERGEVIVDGHISAICFSEAGQPPAARTFLSRLRHR